MQSNSGNMIVKKKHNLILVILIFGTIYSLISIVNHYHFRTYALDLGAYTNALYDYTHFQWNDSTVFKNVGENLLADHFDLYLILFSPFSLIFGTYTLLILQIVFLLFGAIGIYKFFETSPQTARFSIHATIYYCLFFGVFSALSFDYHSNVVAASLVPWFFYLIKKGKLASSSLLLLAIIVAKENTSLWLVFVCLGLAIQYRKDSPIRNYLMLAALFCLIYFISITSFVMPAFSNGNTYPHFQYSILGENFHEAIFHLLRHPFEMLKILFTNHTNNPHGDYVKLELHALVILSGLPLLLKKPQFLLMLIPIYFQKLFHDNVSMWGIGGQYNIEFAPIMAIGIFMTISEFKNIKLKNILSVTVLSLTLFCTLRTMDNTIFPISKSRIRLYQASHYTSDYNESNLHRQFSLIPKDAIVSAQSAFVPQMALRDKIYQFPLIKDAEYVVYSMKENSYPITGDEFIALVNQLENSNEWSIQYKDEDITILKRKCNPVQL